MNCLRLTHGICFLTLAALVFGLTPALHAEHARIDLRVIGAAGREVTATSDTDPPPGGRNMPPVLTAA